MAVLWSGFCGERFETLSDHDSVRRIRLGRRTGDDSVFVHVRRHNNLRRLVNVHCVVSEQGQMITVSTLLNRGAERHALEVFEVVPSGAVEVFDKGFSYAAHAVVITQCFEPLSAQNHAALLMADYLPVVTVRPLDQSVQVRLGANQCHEPTHHAAQPTPAGRSREALPEHAWVSAFQRTASKQTGDDSVSVLDDKDELRNPTVNGGFRRPES